MRKLIILTLVFFLSVCCVQKSPEIDRIIEDGVEVVLNHIKPYRIKGQSSTFSLEKAFSSDTERTDLVIHSSRTGISIAIRKRNLDSTSLLFTR